MRTAVTVLPIIAALLVGGALYGKHRLDHYEPSEYVGPDLPKPAQIARVGDTIAPLNLIDIAGKSVTIGGDRSRRTLIHYWASWCLPCVQELPAYQVAQSKLDALGIELVTVAQDDREHAGEIVERQKVSLPVLVADGANEDPLLALGSAMDSVPFNVLLDQHGTVIAQKLGVIAGGTDGLVAWMGQPKGNKKRTGPGARFAGRQVCGNGACQICHP